MSTLRLGTIVDQTPTTTGSKDYTYAGFGGENPKFALIVVSYCDTLVTDSIDEALFSQSYTDGTTSYAVNNYAKHNVSTTKTRTSTYSSAVLLEDESGIKIQASFTSWITNGIRLNFTTVNPTPRNIYIVLFGGDAITNAKVDKLDNAIMPAVNNYVDYSGIGFAPNIIFNMSATYLDLGITTDVRFANGFFCSGVAGIKQKSFGEWWFDSKTTSKGNAIAASGYSLIHGSSNEGAGGSDGAMEITNVHASGIRFYSRLQQHPGSVYVGALKLASDYDVTALDIVTPATTGYVDYTTTGITPRFMYSLGTLLTTYNSSAIDNKAGSCSINCGMLDISGNMVQFNTSTSYDIGVSTTSAHTRNGSNYVILTDDNNIDNLAVFNNVLPNTLRLQWTTANSGRLFPTLVIGAKSSSIIPHVMFSNRLRR